MAHLFANFTPKKTNLCLGNIVFNLIAWYAGGQSGANECARKSGDFFVNIPETVNAFALFSAKEFSQTGFGFDGRIEQVTTKAALKQGRNIHGIPVRRLQFCNHRLKTELHALISDLLPEAPLPYLVPRSRKSLHQILNRQEIIRSCIETFTAKAHL